VQNFSSDPKQAFDLRGQSFDWRRFGEHTNACIFSSVAFSIASTPSTASPQTAKLAFDSRKLLMSRRFVALSSAIRMHLGTNPRD
jgi:hypothetical protein